MKLIHCRKRSANYGRDTFFIRIGKNGRLYSDKHLFFRWQESIYSENSIKFAQLYTYKR